MEETVTETKTYSIYKDACPHCKVRLEVDYVILPRVQKHRFDCPGCGKVVFISKND